ncbi:MAG TPA: ATP-binding protein [Nitrosomonas sp.]|nr:ATP-binding protein [Nitrosomonas sp.]
MRLVEVKLTNFRGYANETPIGVDDLTVFVGRNDAGKSSVLEALDVFFNDATIEREDRCVRTDSDVVRIACVFERLPASIVIDEQYATSLSAEYLLRQDGRLEIIKEWDCSAAKGKLTGVFAKAFHPAENGIDDLLSLKLTELRAKALQRAVDLSNVIQTAKAPLRQAIWGAAGNLNLSEREIPLKKESAKDAYDQLQKHMPLYALFKSDRASTDQDAEAQDPLKAAIKEAISRRTAELGTVLNDIQTELENVAARTVDKIREMNPELANQLHPSVKNKSWESLFNVSLTGDDDIPINKRGSGTRRLVLLNFFRARAENAATAQERGVIYAVEEPETSQHPNHQLMLLEAFEQLVEQGGCQILITTHTPTLARRVDQSFLRLITKENGEPVVEGGVNGDATLQKIVDTLGVLPDHDVKVFLGVEGKHDISFLKNISAMLSAVEPDIPDLPAKESSGELIFIPLGGSSLELWVNRLQGFNRSEFYLTDRDNQPPQQPKYQAQLTAWTARGCTVWVTSKRELENYIHKSLILAAQPSYTGTGADFEDVPLLLAEATHAAAPGAQPWTVLTPEKKKEKSSAAKKRLNNTIAQQMTPALLTQTDPTGEIRQWLRAIGTALNA